MEPEDQLEELRKIGSAINGSATALTMKIAEFEKSLQDLPYRTKASVSLSFGSVEFRRCGDIWRLKHGENPIGSLAIAKKIEFWENRGQMVQAITEAAKATLASLEEK